jgi:(3S)-malyl-CoA thioesterase
MAPKRLSGQRNRHVVAAMKEMPAMARDDRALRMPLRHARSLLFVPAHRTRALEKAQTLDCDMIIIDLEDAVPEEQRNEAREAMKAAVNQGFGDRLVSVRINSEDSPHHGMDMVAVREVRPDYIVLPKADEQRQLHDVHAVCQAPVIAMIEGPRGVVDAPRIAAHGGVAGLLAGTNDLKHELNLPDEAPRSAIAFALQMIVLAARAHDIAAFDGVFNGLDDLSTLEAECLEGRMLGFDGKSIIHPDHIAITNRAFSPDEAELARAAALIQAYSGGAQRHDGRMIEEMHVEQARRLLDRAATRIRV